MTNKDRLFEKLLESTVNHKRNERVVQEIDFEIDRLIAQSQQIAQEEAQQ